MKTRTTRRFLDDHLGNFIDALEAANDETSVRFALQKLAANAGFDSYAYVDIRAGDNKAFSNYDDEWQKRYASENYISLDPVVTQARRTMRPTAWSHAEKHRYGTRERRFFDEAREFGIASGITVPIRGGFGSFAMLSLAANDEYTSQINIRDVALAATAVAYVHSSLLRFSNNTLAAADTTLSPRELTCMIWASMGKTKNETAKLLGLKEKTVRFYLERAREKLGASNIAHAVRIAMERDLL